MPLILFFSILISAACRLHHSFGNPKLDLCFVLHSIATLRKGKDIQTLLFVVGLTTLTQTVFGTRLPAVIGGSYTFVPTMISIILANRYSDIVDPQEKFERTMRGTQRALIVASTLQIALGFSGLWCNITRFMSPLSTLPLVALSGYGLYEFGFLLVVYVSYLNIKESLDRMPLIMPKSISFFLANFLTGNAL
ncbi:hypothetical protein L1987_38876 [Smallanthus sonchifolius]|uniref:Uncharacterized protein n=1 Tax=Smallanthus sonchifolius TaxID=185202 RepID=A0ACB9HLS1_9ASTR|nr:hypothetical protein L1987_38876 [Smallanthus sonchifolius]